jgi:hypothetical protein
VREALIKPFLAGAQGGGDYGIDIPPEALRSKVLFTASWN